MRISFYPSVYEHAAYLIGKTPWEVSRSGELLFFAHRAAYLRYRHSPIVVGIDIYNVEAEAYGCIVSKPRGNEVPAVIELLFSSVEEASVITSLDPSSAGRIPMIVEVGRRLVDEFPEAKVSIPVSGPFSIAANLRGIGGLLEDVGLFPVKVSAFLMRLVNGQVRLCEYINKAGVDITFFESAATPPLLSPEQFREVELPSLKKIISKATLLFRHSVPCIIGGNTVPILEEILGTGTNYVICPVETDQIVFMKKMQNYPKVKVRINLDTNILVSGTREQILSEVNRILALADGRPNVLLGTGVVPYGTPPENIELIKNYVEKL